jgi:hypothetical protein
MCFLSGKAEIEKVHNVLIKCPISKSTFYNNRVHRGSSSPFWSSAESAAGRHHADLDSNYGCGDTASVTEIPEHFHHQVWLIQSHLYIKILILFPLSIL